MSLSLQVELTGWSELADMLQDAFPSEIQDAVKEAVELVGQRTFQDVRHFTPVRTGHLLSSESVEEPGVWSFMIKATAYYAQYVEFGTRHMAPRLFMHRALALHQDELNTEINSAVQNVLAGL